MKFPALVLGLLVTLISFAADVENGDQPVRGVHNLEMSPLWTVDMAGDEIIGAIQNIAVADDDRVYILDSKNYLIHIFADNGSHISSFGGKGEGPGELRTVQMGDQLFISKGHLLFVDRGRYHVFTLDGQFLRTVVYPVNLRPRAFVSPDRFVSAPATVDNPRSGPAALRIYNVVDQTDTLLTTFETFAAATATSERGGGQMTIGIVVGEITPLMLVAYRDGRIFYGKSDNYRIHVVDLQGEKVGTFSVKERKRTRVEDRFFKDLEERLGDVPQDMLKRILDGLPREASYFDNITIGEDGLIYVRVSDPNSEGLKPLDIFSPSGEYLYRAEIRVNENESIQTINLSGKRMYIACENEDGDVTLTAYAIQTPRI